jgi:hypothetical protein
MPKQRVLALVVIAGLAAIPATAVFAVDISCKERCENWCMGNDTPTGRAQCLKNEKCSSKPACPPDTRGTSSGTKFDPGSSAPTPKVQVPRVHPGGVALKIILAAPVVPFRYCNGATGDPEATNG